MPGCCSSLRVPFLLFRTACMRSCTWIQSAGCSCCEKCPLTEKHRNLLLLCAGRLTRRPELRLIPVSEFFCTSLFQTGFCCTCVEALHLCRICSVVVKSDAKITHSGGFCGCPHRNFPLWEKQCASSWSETRRPLFLSHLGCSLLSGCHKTQHSSEKGEGVCFVFVLVEKRNKLLELAERLFCCRLWRYLNGFSQQAQVATTPLASLVR